MAASLVLNHYAVLKNRETFFLPVMLPTCSLIIDPFSAPICIVRAPELGLKSCSTTGIHLAEQNFTENILHGSQYFQKSVKKQVFKNTQKKKKFKKIHKRDNNKHMDP